MNAPGRLGEALIIEACHSVRLISTVIEQRLMMIDAEGQETRGELRKQL